MYDQRGQEVAGPVPTTSQTEAEPTEVAEAQSREACAELPLQIQALIEACRGGDLSEILRLSAHTPGAEVVLLKQGSLGEPALDAADLYPEGAFWPQVLARLEQGASALAPEDRLNLARLCEVLPEHDRRDIVQRVFRLPLEELAGAEGLDAEALAALAAQAARLPGPVEAGEEEVEEEAKEEDATPQTDKGTSHLPPARSLATQATLARIGLAAKGPGEAERAEIEETLRHEIGQALYFKQEGAAADRLREDAGWRVVSPQQFVEACEPQAQDTADAVALLEERFGEGRDPEVVEDKGDPDTESAWWTEVEALQDRFPNLVAALQLTRYGKHLQRKAVRGGFAHANFLSRTLSILSPDLYQRLGQWSNEVAVISDKAWAAELYSAALSPGFDPQKAPAWMGPAERAYLEVLKRQYPNPL